MSCCAVNCTNRPSKNPVLQFLRLPLGDQHRLDQWMLNIRRQNWTPTKASRLCSEHFESHHFRTDARGRTCLKDTAVPTIFSYSKGKEQPRGKSLLSIKEEVKEEQPREISLVSIKEEVSDSPIYVVNSKEEVADVNIGSSSNNLAADRSNSMMMENTPEQAFVAQDVVHDNIALTANVWEDVGLGSSVQQRNLSGTWQDSASGHSYTMSTPLPNCSLSDHCYILSESPRTLKRKVSAVEVKLCAARKKLRMKTQQTRRLKARVSALKGVIKVLQKKLLMSRISNASLLDGLDDVPREIFQRIQKMAKPKKQQQQTTG